MLNKSVFNFFKVIVFELCNFAKFESCNVVRKKELLKIENLFTGISSA